MKFSKQDTNIAKTVAIVAMYIHHLFYSKETYAGFSFSFTPLNESQTITLSQCCKVCVAIFVFLTAYGITVSFKKRDRESNGTLKQLYTDNFCRYIKLISGLFVIYALAQCFSFLGRSTAEVYGAGIQRIVFTIIDLLGMSTIFQSPSFNNTWWYISLAITILLLMPLLYRLHKKIKLGGVLTLLALIVPRMLSLEFTPLIWYLPTMCLGILFADKDLFVKWYEIKLFKISGINHLCKIALCAVLLFGFFCWRYKTGRYLDITDGAMTILIICICFELFAERGETIRNIAGFIGKYSMNMFLAHTFIKAYYFMDFTYSFGNAWLILFMLVVVTLALSVAIEFLKKVSGFNRLIDKATHRLQKRYGTAISGNGSEVCANRK